MPANSKKSTWFVRGYKKVASLLTKNWVYNPHRTFQLTRRRDYVRPFVLPGVLAFILEVTQMLWRHKRIFLPLMLIYVILYGVLVGLTSQETYSRISTSLSEVGGDDFQGFGGALAQSGLTLLGIVSSSSSGALTESQQIFAALFGVLAWLTIVWLLRNILAGNKVKMRDGLYSAGAPLIATILVGFVILIQLLPVALAAIGYAAASSSGLIANGGVEAMLFWIAAGLLGLLSLYWVSSSVLALVIVTLPNMYPLKALAASNRLVIGRRVKFILRFLWMALFIVALWVIVMIPVIMFDTWLKSVAPFTEWLPLVPIVILLLSTYTIFWVSTYIYLLYRKVVDHNEPA